MSAQDIQRLTRLQPDSGVRVSTSIIYGVHARSAARLISIDLRNGEYVGIPRNGTSTVHSSQKLVTLTANQDSFRRSLNQSLKGGSTPHPILMLALGTAVGAASGGAGLLFGMATAGLDLYKRDTNVLARKGDEIWSIEEIGKEYDPDWIGSGGTWVATHVSSYFLVDPYRASSPDKGWLIHEKRMKIIF